MHRRLNSAVSRCAVAVITGTAILAFGGSRASAKPPSTDASSGASSAGGSDSAEPSNWAEKKAAKLASEAIGADYWGGHHAMAEKKLREAIQICIVQHCSNAFKARLHRDLGVVYIAGMKHIEEGKDEFAAALAGDSSVTLTSATMEIPSVKQAFDEVKGGASGSSKESSAADAEPASEPEPQEKPDETEKSASKDAESPAEDPAPVPAEAGDRLLNWVSLGIQQDFVFHSSTPNACSPGSNYGCFSADNQKYFFYPDAVVPGGNQVGSAGFQPGTLRVLLGYDRVIGRRFTVGARVGAVILGKARIVQGDRAIMFFHGEARASLWLGPEPFKGSLIRPYVFLSGGLAETDSKVSVQLQPLGESNLYTFNAWKRSGAGFVGAGVGLMVAITKRGGPNVELKYLQFLGPSIPALAMQLGYSLGF